MVYSIIRHITQFLQGYKQDQQGVAAVEMAMITPVLLLLLTSTIDLGAYILDRSAIQSAGRTGVQYFMAGGSDINTATSIVQNSWPNMPKDGKITISQQCMCAGAAAGCYANCDNETTPEVYYDIQLTATVPAILLTDRYIEHTQSVRVR